MVLAIEIVIGIAAFTAIVLAVVLANPLGAVSDYPPAVRSACAELGLIEPREQRFSASELVRKGIALVVFAAVFALVLRRFNGARTFADGFAISYIIWLAIDWWDALVLDCVLACHWRRLRIPGTEDMDSAYCDYAFHIRQSCIGMALGLPACALVGVLVMLL